MTDQDATSNREDKNRRKSSKLENDDPKHCKKCGAKIDHEGPTDNSGRPLTWMPYGPDVDEPHWEPIERCRECWVQDHVDEIEMAAEHRYSYVT